MAFPPFLLGLAIGAGAVALFSKRKEILDTLKDGSLQETFSKTKEFASEMKDNIADKAKSTFCNTTQESNDCGCENTTQKES
ncbi:MAG: YtxH domain-containing protein [Helicobacter sp.]|nr:YtxH domain-containing protein [Helicobacter sp.]